MPWTPEKINLMLSLNEEGLSSSQIAATLDVSRNAVIGKLTRMKVKLALARSPFSRPQEPRIKKKRLVINGNKRLVINGKKSAELPFEEVDVSREEGKTFLELAMNDCRWPFGNADFYFCGRKAEPGKPYCPSHSSLSCTRAMEPTNVAKTFYGFRR